MSEKFDILIVGGGPAGISAALTGRNRGKNVGIIKNPPETSHLHKAELIKNYPGMALSGKEMMESFTAQLNECGAEIIEGKALNIMPLGKSIGVAVGSDFYESTSVIICTGMGRRPLCSGETEFLGRGVSYCATCDGMLYKGKRVAVIGDSAEAEEDAKFLRDIGCEVECFSGREKLEISGGMKADTLTVNGKDYKTDCIFILKETLSAESLVSGIKCVDGKIEADRKQKTNIPGIFAAGDCTGAPYQLAKAVGEGNVAALSACEYISEINKGDK